MKAIVESTLVLRVRLPLGLAGDLSDRHLAGIERAIKSCPASETLLQPPRVEISIEAPPPADRRTA